MTPRRPFAAPLLVAVVAFALATTACARIASPEGWASPVLGDGLLLAAHDDKLFALEAETLEPRWAFPSPEQRKDIKPIALYGTPAIGENTVFVPTYDGTLYALNAESGEVRWFAETGGSLIGGAAVSDDTVYFGSGDGKVYALDAKSGELRWEPFETGDGVWSTPVVSGNTVYVTSLDRRLYAIDVATGTERWSFKTGAGVASPPVVDQAAGLVYVGGFDSKLRAIDLETREERWSVGADNWFWTQLLVNDGVVYAGSLDGTVHAIDVQTGESRWAKPFSTEAPVRAAPVAAGDVLIVVDKDGKVYSIDPASGTAKAEALDLEADVLADPVVRPGTEDGAGEEVLIVTKSGELVRLDPATLRVLQQKKLTAS